jgi:hypothetical protein
VALSTTEQLVAMYCRVVDRLAAEISGTFTAAGIDHVLLKGPAFAAWLYDEDEIRPYGDADFLIQHHDWSRATDVLRGAGFEDALADMAHPRMESFHSHPWRSPRGEVDMHASLEGLGAEPDVIWRELTAQRGSLRLPDGELDTLAEPGNLLHAALHVAQHRDGNAVTDLARALERVGDERWAEAAALADRVAGMPAFLSGLNAIEPGRELIRRLELADAHSVETLLRAGQVPLAEGLHELSQARGLRAKLALLIGELAPKPAFMRWWSPLARRGRAGLALAYLWRPVYLASRLPAAGRALWHARRRASS